MRDGLAGASVEDRLLGRQLARQHADEAQVADELVVERLEHLADEIAGFARLHRHFLRLLALPLGRGPLLALRGGQGKASDGVEQLGDADVLLGGGEEDGDDRAGGQRLGNGAAQLVGADGAFHQVLFHQGVVGFDDGVEQLGAGRGDVHRDTGRRLVRRVKHADHAAELRCLGRPAR